MDKPRGIKIIAILILIFSGLSFLGTIFMYLLWGLSSYNNLIIEVIGLVLTIIFIIGAVGLLKYKEWGRKIVIFTAIGFLLLEISNIIYAGIYGISLLLYTELFMFIIGAILYGLLIFYLSKKKVKEAFQ